MTEESVNEKQRSENAVSQIYASILLDKARTNKVKTVVITSPSGGDGKTYVAFRLSKMIARSGRSVLLITIGKDGGFKMDPAVAEFFPDAANEASVMLREKGAAAIELSQNLFVFNSIKQGEKTKNATFSDEFDRLISLASNQYEYIIIDAPALDLRPDAAIISHTADATYLVIQERHTSRASTVDACNKLKRAGANVVGIIMNKCEANG